MIKTCFETVDIIMILLNLNNFENDCVFAEDAEDVEDAHDDPGLHGRQALRLRRVGRHAVEDVHQDKEQGDEECHST
jgi:hypothetical protein